MDVIHSYFFEWHKKIIHSNHNVMKAAILEMYDSECLSDVKGLHPEATEHLLTQVSNQVPVSY